MLAVFLKISSNLFLWGAGLFALVFIVSAVKKTQQTDISKSAIILLRFVICVLGSAAVIAGTNYLVNPFGFYPPHFLPVAARLDRSNKLQMLKTVATPPQIIIFGSSRSMAVDASYFTRTAGIPAFNAGVGSASPRDYLALTMALAEQKRLPRLFIVGLGFEQMSSLNDADTVHEPFDPLDQYVPNHVVMPSLLGIDQTQATLKVLVTTFVDRSQLRSPYQEDGTIPLEARPSWVVEKDIDALIATKPIMPATPSETQLGYLQSFLELCKRNKVEVIIYFPPYHPRMLAYFVQNTSFVVLTNALRLRLDNLQKVYGFKSYDFTELKSFGGTVSDIYGDFHPTSAGNQKMMNIILGDLRTAKFDAF